MTKKNAFSLIELSVALIVIGILLVGVTTTKRLIYKSRLNAASNLTKNSGVEKIDGLIIWLETTLPNSFIEIEAQQEVDLDEDASYDGISVWYDLQNSNPSKHNATQSTAASRPKYYRNCINDLPCIKFDGNDLLEIDLSDLAYHDYTIFVIEQRRSSGSNIFIGGSSTPSSNSDLILGYAGNERGLFSHGSPTNYYTFYTNPVIASYSSPIARLHTFLNPMQKTGVSSVYQYLNGSSTASALTSVRTPAYSALTASSSGRIGYGLDPIDRSFRYYTGDIGEIIIYNRALETFEREAVENYLLKKWKITSL